DDRRDGNGRPVRRVEADDPGNDEFARPPPPGAQQDDEAADGKEHVDAQVAVARDPAESGEGDRGEMPGVAGERVVVEDNSQRRGDAQQVDLVWPARGGCAAAVWPPGPG